MDVMLMNLASSSTFGSFARGTTDILHSQRPGGVRRENHPKSRRSVSVDNIVTSEMSAIARQEPKFPWDCDVPNTAFWNSLDYKIGRGFLSCYDESEIAQMTFDGSLNQEEKLEHLKSILNRTLESKKEKAAPASLSDVDYRSWSTLKMALGSIEHSLGDRDANETVTRELYHNGPNGSKDMSALHRLSGLLEESGRYAEAEAAAREVLPWLEGHSLLNGRESPQALGCMKILVRSIWKQTRYGEAEGWIEACQSAIETMGTGKFAKYQEDERRQLEGDVEALREWRHQREAQ